MSHAINRVEQMLKDQIQVVEKWDLAPKAASLWWTSTHDSENMVDLSIGHKRGHHCGQTGRLGRRKLGRT